MRDPNKFQILWITVSYSTFDRELLVCLNADISILQTETKDQYFYWLTTLYLMNVSCVINNGNL